MRNHETAILAYARLARLSHAKQQAPGRDRFLVLAGYEACQAGWLEVAARCCQLVLLTNSRHLLGKTESFPETIRDPSNDSFFNHLGLFSRSRCSACSNGQNESWMALMVHNRVPAPVVRRVPRETEKAHSEHYSEWAFQFDAGGLRQTGLRRVLP